MGDKIKRTAAALRGFRRSRPREFFWSIYGILGGVLVGASIGGIGIAVLGSAFGVPAFVIFAIIGGMIGNRVGVEKDRATLGK
ncbi:hypothetical protein QA641_18210 [Bradyrhizobium sp. CB1650]|uniref:hypothetical protein n=1 Tax=Bradyrhizobium sp. CB1650 TaxID=3039153 RepID=UPI0024353251|nr:hypothetical protein [Bradyrhizobium sp. CB1650]WGD55642.1 hypothetical protein QA641_18210 [Bradyrhizobium sp. CB1650]